MRPTFSLINLDNLRKNVEKAKEISRAPVFMGVIKAQAYGHGALPVARAIEDIVDYFGIATVEEGLELRKGGISKPIAVLGGFYPGEEEEILSYNLEPAVFKGRQIKSLSLLGKRRGKPLKVHLKIDTGLGRLGVPWSKPDMFGLPDGVEVVSAFTTLASADNIGIPTVDEQIERMEGAFSSLKLRERGTMISMANSAALILHPESHGDMVRPGIILYGIPPFPSNQKGFYPVMDFRSRIVFIKEVPEGTPLGYGGSYVTDGRKKIATVPVGYDDGIPRRLSNKGWFYVKGMKAPIVGRVSMDLTLIDISEIDGVREGDEVVVFSSSQQLWALSELLGTIPYEILCGVGKRVYRIYNFQGKKDTLLL